MSRGLEDPLKDTQQLSWLLHGVQRWTKTRIRLPINPKLLQQLIESILNNRQLSKYDWYLYATAISIAYFGCLRAGEVSYPSTHSFYPKQHLTIKDIIIHQNTVQLRLKSSKTDQFRRGATIIIGPSKQNICPVQITKQLLYLMKHAHKSDAIFRLKDGSLLTDQDSKQWYTTHCIHSSSQRSSLVPTACALGQPLQQRKPESRWRSSKPWADGQATATTDTYIPHTRYW